MEHYTLYIHASNNVIKPVQIDLAAVNAAPQNNWQLAAGEAMAHEIASQIEQQLPKSQARNALASIRPILKHLNFVAGSYLDGIVITVPGVIDEPPRAGATPGISSAQVQKQLDQLQKQYEQQLRRERDAAAARQAQLEKDQQATKHQLVTVQLAQQASQQEAQKLQRALQSEEQQQSDLEGRLQEAMLQLTTKDLQLQHAKEKVNELTLEQGKLKTEVQQFQAQQKAQGDQSAQIRQIEEKYKKDLAELKIQSENRELARQLLEKKFNRTQEDLKQAQEQIKKLQNDYNTLKSQYDDLRGKNAGRNSPVLDRSILD